MIPVVNPIPEPAGFTERCRRRGLKWLRRNRTGEPPDYWSEFRLALAAAFQERCGFGGMWISSGTIDHFISRTESRRLSYRWSNFRYVESWLNSSKNKRRSADLLDPFEVREGWFIVELPSLQLKLTDAVPAAMRQRAEHTLKVLPLRDDERIVKQRRAWLQMYEQGTPLAVIAAKAPLIAAAIVRQNWPQAPVAGT